MFGFNKGILGVIVAAQLCSYAAKDQTLINSGFIEKFLTKKAAYADSHGATGDYLGTGLLYYTLAYISKAKVCVCLGSGGGFVPRIMKQAQRELRIKESETHLVDGNIGSWGRPEWIEPTSFFKKHYPDVLVHLETTASFAKKWNRSKKIDYLHIDADHSFEGALRDFEDYLPFMAPNGIITFHDTAGDIPCARVVPLLKERGFEVVNFMEFGAGVAIIHLGGDL